MKHRPKPCSPIAGKCAIQAARNSRRLQDLLYAAYLRMMRLTKLHAPTSRGSGHRAHSTPACSACKSNELAGKTVAVVGLGVSGRAAAKLALAQGARVLGLDSSSAAARLEASEALTPAARARCTTLTGPLRSEDLAAADLVIVSPGVPIAEPALQHALPRVPVVSELAFAAACLPRGVCVTAITGTNGKSTTTEFTAQLLEAAGLAVWKGGNLGVPLSELACLLMEGHRCEHAVVEVSSYQLEAPGQFRPDAACILNLAPDHLERHKSMQEYAKVKLRLFQHMNASSAKLMSPDCLRFVPSGAVPTHSGLIGTLPGCKLDGDGAALQLPDWPTEERLNLRSLGPAGAHNRLNAACAAYLALSVAPALRVAEVEDAVQRLRAPPHRMQLVAEASGLAWYDDSKATNVAAAKVAIGCLEEEAVVLLGGQGKRHESGHLGFEELANNLAKHLAIITFGADGAEIAAELRTSGARVDATFATLLEATRAAASLARERGASTVLLSPGCASFDEFRDYSDRGDKFLQYVRDLDR